MPDLETAWLRVERHLTQIGGFVQKLDLLTQLRPKFSDALIGGAVQLTPWILALLDCYLGAGRSRAPSAAQRQRFTEAVQEAHAHGSYSSVSV
jgi:hypothetical protein